jgi:hypothetical protein
VRSAELDAAVLWTLLPISAAAGMLSVVVFHWTSNRTEIRRTANLILAHILEFRLFLDEPIVVLRAQWNVVRANAQLLRLMLIPGLILAVPSIVLVAQLNARYGRAPWPIGEAVVVSASNPAARLAMPAGIAVETPPVHSRGQVAWRVRPSAIVSIARITRDNGGITLPFPPARILGMHWLVWFSFGFAIAALGTAWLL